MTQTKSEVAKKEKHIIVRPDVIGSTGSVFHFFAERGTRETVESVVVAVLLAFLFRTFLGEPFMIPTGSMAPGLWGHQIDHHCEKCGIEYQTGASQENNLTPPDRKEPVTTTICPVCAYPTKLNRKKYPEHTANFGDRILVNKYAYDFSQPERFDVIVFKNPNNGKQNLIKRLVGMPGENITLSRGDVYCSDLSGANRKIVRKPADKQLAVLIMVDDTHYRAKELDDAGWPVAWFPTGDSNGWSEVRNGRSIEYSIKPGVAVDSPAWLNYRHIRPEPGEWEDYIEDGEVAPRVNNGFGSLISDYYSFNDHERLAFPRGSQIRQSMPFPSFGNHWVGDLAVDVEVVPVGDGKLHFMLVEGGAEFLLTIDIATGEGTTSCSDPAVKFASDKQQTFTTPVRAGTKHRIVFCNADNKLFLWVNGRHVDIPGAEYDRPERIYPVFNAGNAGDANPVRIGVEGAGADLNRIRVLRDLYYVAARGAGGNCSNETGIGESTIEKIHRDPQSWSSENGKELFDASLRTGPPMFVIPDGCFFPMGDNSPESLDARVWPGDNFFSGELMLGRAMLVYFPHSTNTPVPYLPNFSKMRVIK